MAEETTLLAYLVPRITSRVEDTATDALAFILTKSEDCRKAFNSLLQDKGFMPEPIEWFQTQVTYEDGSRPDMNGYDKNHKKRLLVESKFWASLLGGQASGYFDQLEAEGPGVLLFIAPESRLITLWTDIERQMVDAGKTLEPIETHENTRKARIVGSDKGLMLVNWALLLRHMADAVASDSQVTSDIQQLLGLVKRQGDDEFQPIRPEESSPALARRMLWISQLIDDVVDSHGVKNGWMTTESRRATPQREGYGRYFRFFDGSSPLQGDLFLCVNHQLWATSADTPSWLWISSIVQIDVEKLQDIAPQLVLHKEKGPYDVPVYLKNDVGYHDVLDDVVRQIKKINDLVER